MSSKTPRKIHPGLILWRIDELRRAGVSDDLVEEIEILADRCVPRDAIGGGRNSAGNRLRYKCPTCGSVLKGPQYNTANAEDNICFNCKQHIHWWSEDEDEDDDDGSH